LFFPVETGGYVELVFLISRRVETRHYVKSDPLA
jgi:hypothetical protein